MNSDTILIRQIHPSFVQDGRVGSNAFCPTPKDEGKLSTYDGDKIDAEGAWQHYTGDLRHSSVGAYGFSVGECESLDLPVSEDPEPFPEHVLVDFTAHGSSAVKKKGKKLRKYAVDRGWLYQQA
ncbi:hypothetical protein LF1_20350 [Rubripirellula obstinata]|uniref:Uncharacterized protein n=1 Tax=Rubripirellula obstinata TaxID=406547 RepID=A0A5B1CH10_9BACT|nr:hypothetical protein [Rubripirellula obstinata]KAA1259501.1 hypothetical protein LF1_20350 [Rubripirellula obstinata]